MKDLMSYLQTHITKWKEILNNHYKTDSGRSLEEYAKGALEAHIQTLDCVEKLNDK